MNSNAERPSTEEQEATEEELQSVGCFGLTILGCILILVAITIIIIKILS